MPRYLGYDPGGDDNHGVATLEVSASGVALAASTQIVRTGDDARMYFATVLAQGDVSGLGVDTLTQWSLGSAGWRAADTWLRDSYREVQKSVVSPNSIAGSMCLNGIGVVHALRETHPDWANSRAAMHDWLRSEFAGVSCPLATEHDVGQTNYFWPCDEQVVDRACGRSCG
ncbi:MAG: hypothetical protein QM756_44125 [Polyangiaceae bacterium]